MLDWLARRVIKDAWFVVIIWIVAALIFLVTALTGWGGPSLFDRLEAQAASIEGAESTQGQKVLDTLAGDGQTVTLLVTGVDITSLDKQKEVAQALEPAHNALAKLVGEANVIDPFVVPRMLDEPAAQALASTNRDGFLVLVTVDPNGETVAEDTDEDYRKELDRQVTEVETRLQQVPEDLRPLFPEAQGVVTDDSLVAQAINTQVQKDLVHGEVVALPLALVLMVLVFGGFLVAGMPILGALASIAGTLGILYALSLPYNLPSFVVNITTVIGLGLSIDYGLLLTSRYRQELAAVQSQAPVTPRRRRSGRRDSTVQSCMRETMRTAGRTVLFSALIVAVSMAGMLFMGTSILKWIAVAGMAVTLLAVTAALTLVPAVLVLLGNRMMRPSLLQRLRFLGLLQRTLGDVTHERGVFSWLAHQVNRMPWVVLVACTAFLLVLASPARNLHMLSSTTEILPTDSDQRRYVEVLQADYPAAAGQDATLIIAGTGPRVTSYINSGVAATEGVTNILQSATAGSYTVVYLDLDGGPASATAEQAVRALRAIPPPADTWVTGQAASQVDFHDTVKDGLVWVVITVSLATVVLLFLMTGSVLVPLKALVMNVLSLLASIGVLTWIMQEGHFMDLLDFQPIGGLETYVVVTAVSVGFGLAMDYEVFLLARVKEYWDAGQDNDAAVTKGLQRSGRVVTFAALIMVTVFLGFVSGDLLVIKEIGLALAIIVVIDVTVVRMLLVPATMTLLGRWNWWAPKPLKALYERYGLARLDHQGRRGGAVT